MLVSVPDTAVKRKVKSELQSVYPFLYIKQTPLSYSCGDVGPVSVASRSTVLVMTLMHNRTHTGPAGTEEHGKEALGAVRVSGQ